MSRSCTTLLLLLTRQTPSLALPGTRHRDGSSDAANERLGRDGRRRALSASKTNSCDCDSFKGEKACPGDPNATRGSSLWAKADSDCFSQCCSESYVCNGGDNNAQSRDWQVFGTSLGGWLVLEPWITPSLFYQFMMARDGSHTGVPVEPGKELPLEAVANQTAVDMYTFCKILGPEKGNLQLRRHWKAWVQEEDIAAIAATGANTVRIPIGDWMYKPYEPFTGCTDGAMEELERALRLCDKYGLKVLLDLHAVKESQNGFDNSGRAMTMRWGHGFTGEPEFDHWNERAANWLGDFDLETFSYGELNETRYDRSLEVIRRIVVKYAHDSVIWGLTPVNEPWQYWPMSWIKRFYWDTYQLVQSKAPDWIFVIHDSFRRSPSLWRGFMRGCPNKAMDGHMYQAWSDSGPIEEFHSRACAAGEDIVNFEQETGFPLIIGEWSLATDNCAMWLNGFNDNLPGYPKTHCAMKPCAEPYMDDADYHQPGCPPDRHVPDYGPHGTGVSGPRFGLCEVGAGWGGLAREQQAVERLGLKQVHSFGQSAGWIFWNFRTELEPRWSFVTAYFAGWLGPPNVSLSFTNEDRRKELAAACDVKTCDVGGGRSVFWKSPR